MFFFWFRYLKPLQSFDVEVHPESIFEVDVLGKGQSALEETNEVLGKELSIVSGALQLFWKLIRKEKSSKFG